MQVWGSESVVLRNENSYRNLRFRRCYQLDNTIEKTWNLQGITKQLFTAVRILIPGAKNSEVMLRHLAVMTYFYNSSYYKLLFFSIILGIYSYSKELTFRCQAISPI